MRSLQLLVNGPVRVRRDLQAAVSYTQAVRVIGLGRGRRWTFLHDAPAT